MASTAVPFASSIVVSTIWLASRIRAAAQKSWNCVRTEPHVSVELRQVWPWIVCSKPDEGAGGEGALAAVKLPAACRFSLSDGHPVSVAAA